MDERQKQTITVVGVGHVGLVTAVSLAHLGHRVFGVDSDTSKIERLMAGRIPFFEPGLQEMLESTIASGRLSFDRPIEACLPESDVVFICVGTPPRASGEASLVAVENATRTAARLATGRTVVVQKSTVPTGTAGRMREILVREGGDETEMAVVSNPEFLREGQAVHDSLNPDRILIGSDTAWALEVMRRVYAPLTAQGHRLIETDIATAELSKHACNAFLAMKVSFVNALAQLCELAGADVVRVAEVMGTDPRIGPSFLSAGMGFGGYCLPKDIQAFRALAGRLGYDFTLLNEIARINEEALDASLAKVERALWNLEEKRVALLGLAFKPGTDDVRFAPALALARRLREKGATVVGYDPHAAETALAEDPELEVAQDLYEAVSGADCIVVCTEWDEFREIDLSKLKELLTAPIVIDGRNVFDPEAMRAAGFIYHPTGRPSVP